MIEQLGNIAEALSGADPADKAEIYRRLGLRLAFDHTRQEVRAETRLGCARRLERGVGEGTRNITPPLTVVRTVFVVTAA